MNNHKPKRTRKAPAKYNNYTKLLPLLYKSNPKELQRIQMINNRPHGDPIVGELKAKILRSGPQPSRIIAKQYGISLTRITHWINESDYKAYAQDEYPNLRPMSEYKAEPYYQGEPELDHISREWLNQHIANLLVEYK